MKRNCETDKAIAYAVPRRSLSPAAVERFEETYKLLGEQKEPEKPRRNSRRATAILVAAALILSLSLTTAAAVSLLTPRQTSLLTSNSMAKKAFESKYAVLLDEKAAVGDMTVSLLGVAPAPPTDRFDSDHTYIVLSVQNNDGTPMTVDFASDGWRPEIMISGFLPDKLNSLHMGTASTGVVEDGIFYYILEAKNLEAFADHTVYLAYYNWWETFLLEGRGLSCPFVMKGDGSIAFEESYSEPHALFELPLDESKADPQRAKELLENLEKYGVFYAKPKDMDN